MTPVPVPDDCPHSWKHGQADVTCLLCGASKGDHRLPVPVVNEYEGVQSDVERIARQLHAQHQDEPVWDKLDGHKRDDYHLFGAPLECGHRVRIETLTVCVREGWVSDHAFYVRHGIRAETGLTYWWERCRETLLTEDGVIALGLWRQKLARRPPEELSIEGADRDLIRAAAIAYEHGFALAPVSDEARGNARRLARGAFARRCFLGNSVRGLTVTAIGQVEAREGDEG